jgi:HK97 family phage portal protein
VGLVSTLLERRSANITLDQLDEALDSIVNGRQSYTGKNLATESALETVVVYACVSLLAETIASLPLPLYRRLPGGGKTRDNRHRLYPILHDLPNPEMTSAELREALVGHLALWGNCYCEIERGDNGIRALWPLRPDRMVPKRTDANQLYWEYTLPNGIKKPFADNMIFRVHGLSSNGIQGYSPIAMARQSIALAQATEEYGARFFGNDSRPGGVLRHPGTLKNEGRANLKKSWDEMHRGLSNSHRIAILEEGMTWEQIGIPPEEAQFLESRKFQRSEISMLYRIPPHMISDTERNTSWGVGIEVMSIGFVTYTLRPWLVKIESAIYRSLLTPAERYIYFAEHLVDGLLRGDAVTRAQALQIQRQNGVINADEWRELENRNPLPDDDGQEFWRPANMAVVGEEPPVPVAAPEPMAETKPVAAPAAKGVPTNGKTK